MKLDRKSVLIATGAGLIVIVSALPARRPQTDVAPESVRSAPAVQDASSTSRPATAGQLDAQRARSQALEWGRDPFARTASTTGERDTQTGARLTGVSIRGDDRIALIGHDVVREGDTLASGFTVHVITKDSVTLRSDNEEVVLRLGGEE